MFLKKKKEFEMWESVILENLLKKFFQEVKQSDIQIDNFNHMIDFRLRKMIEDELINIRVDNNTYYRIYFNNIFIDKPSVIEDRTVRYITPKEARIRDITYSGSVLADINTCYVTMSGKEVKISDYKIHRKKCIAKIPIMVNSVKCNLHEMTPSEKIEAGECKYDNGGYFIIRGKERVLVSQERMNYNDIYCFESKSGNRIDTICEIRSISDETKHSVYLQMKYTGNRVMLSIPFIQNDIPLGYIFAAFGKTTNQILDILQIMCKNDDIDGYFNNIILDMIKIRNKESAIDYISENSVSIVMKENRKKFVEQILYNEIFPHLGITSSRTQKILFLCRMYRKLMKTIFKNQCYDNRDHLNNKRLEMSGCLIHDLFKTLFKRYIKTISVHLEKRQDIVVILNKITMISLGINHCFCTGNWGVPKSAFIRLGVSQILSRLTNPSYNSHLLRVLIPIGKEAKNTKVRQIHTSSIGFYCPMETPEGQQSGIVKNLCPYIRITKQYNMPYVKDIITDIEYIIFDFDMYSVIGRENTFLLFLNGNIVGFTHEPEKVLQKLYQYKKVNIFMIDISISIREKDREIHIFTDEGRLQRPVFCRSNLPTIEDLKEKSFLQLVKEKKIIYLDSYEIENRTIAMNFQQFHENPIYDTLEIHPSLIVGFSVNLIPFPHHTQSPRITYHCAMGKQSISLPFTNIHERVDTMNYILCYPESPITQSHHAEYNHLDKLGIGNNLCVAIMMFSGYNQEDSVILNKAAIDRGLLRCFSYRTIIVEEKKKSTVCTEKIEKTPLEFRNNCFNYSKVDENGIIKVGSTVGCGDVIVCKLQKVNNKENITWRDSSVIIKPGEEGIVDRVFLSSNIEGYKIIKIKIRVEKIPEIGDKLASRNAQKGTISIILDEKDMPFTEKEGIVPDLILNPLCIPSRMTINQLIETYLSKKSIHHLKKYYSTIFFEQNKKDIMKELQQDNTDFGNEYMINGMTGEKLKTKIFFGPCYYHRLKHLVSNKVHSRNSGNIQLMTRQPLEGRSRDGGLRVGEMERDCIIAHGTSRLLRERLFEVSDYFEIHICNQCGNIPHKPSFCNFCKKKNIVKIPLPYACKLLFQQLMALGIQITIFTKSLKK